MIDQDTLLQFYGLFKQAKDGDATDQDAPSMFDFKSKAKFKAWRFNTGLSTEECQKYYILQYASLDSGCEENAIAVLQGDEEAEEGGNQIMKSISLPKQDTEAQAQYIGRSKINCLTHSCREIR